MPDGRVEHSCPHEAMRPGRSGRHAAGGTPARPAPDVVDLAALAAGWGGDPVAVRAVIFDMDGLMIDTERLARDAWRRAMSEHGYALDDDVYLTVVGRPVEGACPVFVEAFGADLPIAEIEAAKARYLRDALDPAPEGRAGRAARRPRGAPRSRRHRRDEPPGFD